MLNAFDIAKYDTFASIPTDQIKRLPYSIYIIDYDRRYLYVNEYAKKKIKGVALVGHTINEIIKNYPEFDHQTVYKFLHPYVEEKKKVHTTLNSPVSGNHAEITGYPLKDCYYFTVVEILSKENLINDLRKQLKKK